MTPVRLMRPWRFGVGSTSQITNSAFYIREACALLARRGGLTEHVPNRGWMFYNGFTLLFESGNLKLASTP